MTGATATLERPTLIREAVPTFAPPPPAPAASEPSAPARPHRAVEALRRATAQAARTAPPPGTLQDASIETALEKAYERAPESTGPLRALRGTGAEADESFLGLLGWF